MAAVARSEDELGRKWDRCVTDAIIKTGAGFGLGVVFSLVLFRRRAWPIHFGIGFGVGTAYANCERDLNDSFVASKAVQGGSLASSVSSS